jgi:hypothetical protein
MKILEGDLRGKTDWDFIELKMSIDVPALNNWYNTVKEQHANLKFNFSMSHLLKKDTINSSYKDILSPGIHSYGLSWPAQQTLPIPPRYAANPNLYPETTLPHEDFEKNMKIMDQYKFGYFNHLLAELGEDTFAWSRITVHDAGASILPHNDGFGTIRLHIPITTNNRAWFNWSDRKYNFVPGKVYLINTYAEHHTSNDGTTERTHIISHPTNVAWLLENLS